MIRSLLLSVAVGLLAGGVSAQIAKGSPAPAFTIEKGWNDAPTSFDDLAGKVVILDFAQTW
jgi:hypothetical protein